MRKGVASRNDVLQALAYLIAQHGDTFFRDPQRCKAFLDDTLYGQYRGEVALLVCAVKFGIVDELVQARENPRPDVKRLLSSLGGRLQVAMGGLSEDLGTWTAAMWANAMGLPRVGDPGLPRGADQHSLMPEDVFRRLCSAVIADGVVTADERTSLQSLQLLLGVSPESRARLFDEEAAKTTGNLVDDTIDAFQRHDFNECLRLCDLLLQGVSGDVTISSPSFVGQCSQLRAKVLEEQARLSHCVAEMRTACSRRDWKVVKRNASEILATFQNDVEARTALNASEWMIDAHLAYDKKQWKTAIAIWSKVISMALPVCETFRTEADEFINSARSSQIGDWVEMASRSLSANDWSSARSLAQKALDVEPGNPDAARLLGEADTKIHLQELAVRALAAYRSRDVAGCRTACGAYITYLRQTGIHIKFTDVSGTVVDFAALPDRLRAEIENERALAARIRRATIFRRFFNLAAAAVVIALLVTGTNRWRRHQFEKRVRAFESAMQAHSYDTAKVAAPIIASKYPPAADLLAYFRARAAFEPALNGANTGLLQQYGAAKWTELQAQKQAAEANVGSANTGVEAYQRAIALLTECQTLADAGEKARLEKEARAAEQLRERVRKDVDYVITNMSENKPMGNVIEELSAAARESWKVAVDRGWGEGQVLMGVSYQFGIHVDKDAAKGRALVQKAADQGVGLAEFCMAVDIDTERHPEMRDAEISWMKKAAEHGIAPAQATLGGWYSEGYGSLLKDSEAAATWFRRSAEKGYASAKYQLGCCYFQGVGVVKNVDDAVKWIRLAADSGNVEAQYSLGSMYNAGEGVPQNSAESAKWCRKAADQGSAKAQTTLGTMYLDGSGVPRDPSKALMWFRLAADQGLADAQNNIGTMYAAGNGVPASQTEAIKWLRLAARQGHKVAQKNLRQGGIDW